MLGGYAWWWVWMVAGVFAFYHTLATGNGRLVYASLPLLITSVLTFYTGISLTIQVLVFISLGGSLWHYRHAIGIPVVIAWIITRFGTNVAAREKGKAGRAD